MSNHAGQNLTGVRWHHLHLGKEEGLARAAFVPLNKFGGQSYWQVWRMRFCSNAFTALTWGTTGLAWLRAIPSRRLVGAGVSILGLLAASLALFWSQERGPVTIPMLLFALVALVWAAVRFGPASMSTAILSITLLAIGGASLLPKENMLFIYVLFVALTTALMFLATANTERGMAQETFIKAFRSSPAAAIISRLKDGHIIEVNKRWECMLGYRRSEAIGRTVLDLNIYVSPTDREWIIRQVLEGNGLHDAEFALRMKTGELRLTLISADIDDINGERCLFLIVRDVTDLKRSVEQERARIAADIHDDLGARLTEITMLSDLSKSHIRNSRQIRADINQIATRARLSTQSLDEIVWAVSPHQDSLESFINYLQAHASEVLQLARLRCRFDLPSPPPVQPLPSKVRHNLFMACRETLNNVVKHAAATEVSVRIQFRDGILSVTIADNGRGFTASEAPRAANTPGTGRNGLSNLRRRLENVGGKFEMDSRPKAGTTVTLSIDLRNANLMAKAGLDAARNGASDSSAHFWLASKSGAASGA